MKAAEDPQESSEDRLEDWRERLRLRLARKRQMFIVTAAYNAAPFIEQHLESIARQHYRRRRVHQLIFDDASTDGTADRIHAWCRNHRFRHRVEVVRNDQNLGGCANYTRGFRQAPSDSIVLQIDGDDWLPDRYVLAYLNRLYQDPDLWMTYNTWARPDGSPAEHNHAIPEEIVATNRVREYKWISSHLHSFRAVLFAHVKEQDLIDPETGEYWTGAVDQSHYLPMFELAGRHARHLDRITYVYNLHENSLLTSKREKQLACEERIRQRPRYEPLDRLTLPGE